MTEQRGPVTSDRPIVGAIARPSLPPERILAVADAAEAAGLDELWIWEDSFWEGGISMAGAILGRTERLRVGVGLLPVPLRVVSLAAMEIAALDRGFPGRFLPGLGHGVQEWMGQSGVRARSPLTLMREYVTALRSLLSGEEVTTSGDYVRLDRVRLVWPPASPTLLHVGATGPKSLELSGAVGDSTILVSDTTLDDLPRIRDLVLRGRAASGRPGDHRFICFVSAHVEDVVSGMELCLAWGAAGADRVILEPDADLDDPEGFVRWAADVQRAVAEG